jgi:hypothetical protein
MVRTEGTQLNGQDVLVHRERLVGPARFLQSQGERRRPGPGRRT